nr:reverse transcriptase domain-containing protein [Tanacetum cinerariifolium]
RNRRRSKKRIENLNFDDLSHPVVTMADQRTMAQLLQAPIEGYEDEIVVPAITVDNFDLKHGLLTLVQNNEACDRFKYLLRACPHHGFSELHQLDTFYNALNSKDQDSLKSTASGNFLDKMPRECLAIIESKSKVRYSRNKPVVAKVSTNASTSGVSPDVAELKDMVKALLLDKKSQNQSPAPVKACPTSSSGTLPSNTIANPKSDLKAITTRSGVSYDGPQSPPPPSSLPKVVENKPEVTKDKANPTNNGNTKDVQPQAVQSESPILTSNLVTSLISELAIAPVSASKPNPKASIPYPSRRNDERNPLIGNKEKLSEMAQTPLNEHCSVVILKKLPEKLGDPGKFLIPCDFPGMAECLALADLGASINLMPFSVRKRLSLPDLTPMCMTLELADRSISCPVRVAEDFYVKTERALIDVFEGELTLRVGKEAITFNLDQTLRYYANYSDMMPKRIDVINMACEEYSQEVLGFSDTISSGNPTPYYDLIVFATSLTLTPFENSDFLFEEVDAFLPIEDEPTSSEFHQSYLDPEGDILLLEELKICEAYSDKSLVDEPPAVKLKVLPPHLEYAFLEGDDKLLVIIANDLSVEEKAALINVLKSHKRAIAWKLSDIKGINPEFCTHKILLEEDFEPTVQHQRRVNPKIHDVIKQEVIKLLDTGLIYPISDSPWVSPMHCVPKKGRYTVVKNKDDELIPTHLVTGWRVCIDYRKLNEATRKDHFPLSFMD